MEFNSNAGSKPISYTFNCDTIYVDKFIISQNDATWLSCINDPTNKKITVSVTENQGGERTGYITAKLSSGYECTEKKLKVHQLGVNSYDVGTVILTPTETLSWNN